MLSVSKKLHALSFFYSHASFCLDSVILAVRGRRSLCSDRLDMLDRAREPAVRPQIPRTKGAHGDDSQSHGSIVEGLGGDRIDVG